MNHPISVSLIAILLMPLCAGAEDIFFVQLGAYRNIDNARLTQAATLGDTAKEGLASGLTRVRIVGLNSREQALATLDAAKNLGYSDAFIGNLRTGENTGLDIPAYYGPSDTRINAARAKVSPEQHGDIVFLDGKLMLKEGEIFKPLE